MHPTDEPRTMYKRILFTALEGCTDERLIPKMIFFVYDVRETTELRALLVQWLELTSKECAFCNCDVQALQCQHGLYYLTCGFS